MHYLCCCDENICWRNPLQLVHGHVRYMYGRGHWKLTYTAISMFICFIDRNNGPLSTQPFSSLGPYFVGMSVDLNPHLSQTLSEHPPTWEFKHYTNTV